MDTQSEETPGVAMHRGSSLYRMALSVTARRLNHLEISRVAVWFLQRSRFFMRQPTRRLIFSCMLQIYCNGGCVR
jgi:hypothetical protein